MPLPKVHKNEDKEKFISRCASDPVMNREYPKDDQKIAICFSIWRDRNKQKSKGETVEWKDLEDDDRGFLLI
ncbi:MAG: hypothetical protein AABY22_01685 [Nanoarchaeota archaeon]